LSSRECPQYASGFLAIHIAQREQERVDSRSVHLARLRCVFVPFPPG
jgi:hypothetical protein